MGSKCWCDFCVERTGKPCPNPAAPGSIMCGDGGGNGCPEKHNPPSLTEYTEGLLEARDAGQIGG